MKGESYKLEDLEKLYSQMCNEKQNPNPQVFKQQINSISRILIWDDQHQTDLFDFVCEVKMLQSLLDFFGQSRDKQVVNAILGFFTLMLSNLNKQQSVNYFLSHPVITCLSLSKFGNMNNEIADYYINFLKVLSRKITNQNLNLFFNKRYGTFPLLTQSIRFFNHPQSLVRTTCRNIILTIAKLPNQQVRDFMVGFPFCAYFVHESNFIKEYWIIADKIIRSKEDNSYELSQIDTLLQDHEEILIFIDDLLSLKLPNLSQCFLSAFINQCISCLMISLDLEAKQGFSIQVCLFVLSVLFKTFNDSYLIDAIALMVFGKYHSKGLNQCIFQPIPCLLSYDKKWKFKGFWDSHEDKVSQYCMEKYHPNQQAKIQKQPSIMTSIANKIDTMAVFGITNNFYQRQIEKIQNIFGIPIISKQQNLTRRGGAYNINKIFAAVKGNNFKIEQSEINPVSQTILSYLSSKDDTLVMLTLSLFSSLFQNRNISSYILSFCKLSLQPQNRDFQSVIKIEKIIINCLKLFAVDPPCFRICTYVEAKDLTKKLSAFYSPKQFPLSADILAAMRNGLRVSIDRITPYLYSSKQWQKSINIYTQLVKKSSKRRNKNLKILGIVPNQEEQIHSGTSPIDYVYENYPRQFEHQIIRDFWIYQLIRDLFMQFNTIHEFAKFTAVATKTESFKYEQGKTYQKIQDEMMSAQYRRNSQQKYAPCSLLLLTGYFVLLDGRTVQYRSPYDQFVTIFDGSDPRRLFLKGEDNTIWLQLAQASTAQALLRFFEEGRSMLMRYRLAQIVKEVQSLLKCL